VSALALQADGEKQPNSLAKSTDTQISVNCQQRSARSTPKGVTPRKFLREIRPTVPNGFVQSLDQVNNQRNLASANYIGMTSLRPSSGPDAKYGNARTPDERLRGELIDALDEELEQELDDGRLAGLLEHIGKPPPPTLDRQTYFRELLRLQRELVKLQDWVHAPFRTRRARRISEELSSIFHIGLAD